MDVHRFVGPNGAGKSTLLRLVMGVEPPDEGSAGLGSTTSLRATSNRTKPKHWIFLEDRDRHDVRSGPRLDPDPGSFAAGQFLLQQRPVFKEVGKLSGGEKARLALALMLLTPCNLLVWMSLPIHLDIPAKQMLEDALMAYEGAALLVSHDRYFISRVANRIVELREGELVLYRG